jgi:predicted N-acyltransferase
MPWCRRPSRLCGTPSSVHWKTASLGPQSGWQPEHLLHWEGDRLVAALPSYRKWHSYGEYVFDHGWADACERLASTTTPSC